jgi:hypothetical protein
MKPGLKIMLLLYVCVSVSTGVLAQNTVVYSPLEDDPNLTRQLTEATEKRYKTDLGSLSGDHKKQIEELYKERYKKIQRMYTDNDIIADGNAATYLETLAK